MWKTSLQMEFSKAQKQKSFIAKTAENSSLEEIITQKDSAV